MISGQYATPLRVGSFNPAERWSRDASEEIAVGLERRVNGEGCEISHGIRKFIESHLGRPIGVQLSLPLQRAG